MTTIGRLGTVLLLAAGLAAPAAAKDLAASLRGKWVMDKVAAFEADPPAIYKMATPEKQKEMRDKMLKSMPDMIFEFTADTLSMRSGDQVHPAPIKYTKTEKSTVFFETVNKEKPEDIDKMKAQ